MVSLKEESRLDSSSGLVTVAISSKGRNVEKHHHMNLRLHCYLFSVLYESGTLYCCSMNCENLEKDNRKVRTHKNTLTQQNENQSSRIYC